MSGRGMKQKGDNYERELAAYINEHTSLQSFRAPLSGGGHVGLSGGADILGVPSLFIEAKRVERLNFHDAMRQAETNIEKTQSDDVAIVMNRKNRMKTGIASACFVWMTSSFFTMLFSEKRFCKR